MKGEAQNLLNILRDLERESESEPSPAKSPRPEILGKTGFLEEEISFFLTNFRKKAADSGLEEDALIPIKSDTDKNVRKPSHHSRVPEPKQARLCVNSAQQPLSKCPPRHRPCFAAP